MPHAPLGDTDNQSLWAVPLDVRRYLTPLVAIALGHFQNSAAQAKVEQGDADEQAAVNCGFKHASKALRLACRCCICCNKPGCCAGRSQLERAAFHECAFCAEWVLRGYGSGESSLDKAVALMTSKGGL